MEKVTGDKTEHALFNQMVEGFRMAASACRQLGVIQLNTDFQGLAFMTEHLATQAQRLATSKAMNRIERAGGLQRFSEALGGEVAGNG